MDFNVKVVKFWKWFESISNELLQNPTETTLVAEVDYQVNQLGHFDWEIGPLNEGLLYFAVSPGLNSKKLKLTAQIVDGAPKCEGWCFLPSKPPKEWEGIWKMKNELGKEILIDCSNWEYVLYEFTDKTFDMDIVIDNVDGNLDTCYLAIDIALTGYLGEEGFMSLIQNIQILTELDDAVRGKLTQLKYIRKHIYSLSNQS